MVRRPEDPPASALWDDDGPADVAATPVPCLRCDAPLCRPESLRLEVCLECRLSKQVPPMPRRLQSRRRARRR